MKGRTGSLSPHRDPTEIPNKGGQPGFRFTRATVAWRGAARLACSALVAADAGDALLAASTAGPLSADGQIPSDGRGGWGLGPDGGPRRCASTGPLQAPRRDGTKTAAASPLRPPPPPLGARPGGRSTAAPPAAAACGAPWGAGTCVQAAHPGKHPSHLK